MYLTVRLLRPTFMREGVLDVQTVIEEVLKEFSCHLGNLLYNRMDARVASWGYSITSNSGYKVGRLSYIGNIGKTRKKAELRFFFEEARLPSKITLSKLTGWFRQPVAKLIKGNPSKRRLMRCLESSP